MRIHDAKREILYRMWEKMVVKLIEQYTEKGKKFAGIVRKLKLLYPELRNKVIGEFYQAQKIKYIKTLRDWMQKMESSTQDYKNLPSLRRLSVKAFSKPAAKNNNAMPIFKYKPSSDALGKLILKSLDNMI